MVVWAFFGIAFLWEWNENWPFPFLWPLPSFPNVLAYWVQQFHSRTPSKIHLTGEKQSTRRGRADWPHLLISDVKWLLNPLSYFFVHVIIIGKAFLSYHCPPMQYLKLQTTTLVPPEFRGQIYLKSCVCILFMKSFHIRDVVASYYNPSGILPIV